MHTLVLVVFIVVYLGMMLGRIPGLALDRTGIALFGALVLVVFGDVSTQQVPSIIDIPTLTLLFALMVVSSQFHLSGFYSEVVRRVAAADVRPVWLLALVTLTAGVLSALLANDIVCLAVAPVLIEGCARRKLDPVPFLLALACAANVGSAATLIGNPQNILIGQVLRLSFSGYLLDGGIPAVIGLVFVWAVIAKQYSGRWTKITETPPTPTAPSFDRFQTGKGLVVLLALVWVFLFTPFPRELTALAAAAIILCSRRMHSAKMLGLVDWQLLVLFISLFIVNGAVNRAGMFETVRSALASVHIDSTQPSWLFAVSAVLSNIVSNVPAVMFLLPSATHPLSGPALALSSTLAGNLFVVGSIANIIVLDQAARHGVKISWRTHAATGVPITLLTLGIAAVWLWTRGG